MSGIRLTIDGFLTTPVVATIARYVRDESPFSKGRSVMRITSVACRSFFGRKVGDRNVENQTDTESGQTAFALLRSRSVSRGAGHTRNVGRSDQLEHRRSNILDGTRFSTSRSREVYLGEGSSVSSSACSHIVCRQHGTSLREKRSGCASSCSKRSLTGASVARFMRIK